MPDWVPRGSNSSPSKVGANTKDAAAAFSGQKSSMTQMKIPFKPVGKTASKRTPSPDSRVPAPLNKKPRMVEKEDGNKNIKSNREGDIAIGDSDAKAGEDDFDDEEVKKVTDTHGRRKEDVEVLSGYGDDEDDVEKPTVAKSSRPRRKRPDT